MNKKYIPPHEPTEAEIQHAAYLLWIDEGRPEGRDREHWLAAKELMAHHHGRTLESTRGPHAARPPARGRVKKAAA